MLKNTIWALALFLFGMFPIHDPLAKKLKQKDAFTDQADYGILVLGTTVTNRYLYYNLHFWEYDEGKKRPIKKGAEYSIGKKNLLTGGGSGKQETLAEKMEPGTYVLHYLNMNDGDDSYFTCFYEDTIKVKIEAGKIFYIGDFLLSRKRVSRLRIDERAAQRFISNFPGVKEDVILQSPETISYQAPIKDKCPGKYDP